MATTPGWVDGVGGGGGAGRRRRRHVTAASAATSGENDDDAPPSSAAPGTTVVVADGGGPSPEESSVASSSSPRGRGESSSSACRRSSAKVKAGKARRSRRRGRVTDSRYFSRIGRRFLRGLDRRRSRSRWAASVSVFAIVAVIAAVGWFRFVRHHRNSRFYDGPLRSAWTDHGAEEEVAEPPCPEYGCPLRPRDLNDGSTMKDLDSIKRRLSSGRELGDEVGTTVTATANLLLRRGGGGVGSARYLDYYGDADAATLSRGSNRDSGINQDRAIVVQPFRFGTNTQKSGVVDSHEHDFLVGTFDGHGDEGHHVARFASEAVPRLLATKLAEVMPGKDAAASPGATSTPVDDDELVRRALVESFVETDLSVPPTRAMNGGCTASVILRLDRTLYVANAGDSLSFVATYRRSTDVVSVRYLSRKDKPHLPDERSRIEGEGGTIHTPPPPKDPALSRVIVYSAAKRELVGLAMSRSLGDWEWGDVGVTAEPIVDVIRLDDLLGDAGGGRGDGDDDIEVFVVSGSDGLFDARRPQFVADRFADELYRSKGANRRSPILAAEEVIASATPDNENWYRDDITVSVARVEM